MQITCILREASYTHTLITRYRPIRTDTENLQLNTHIHYCCTNNYITKKTTVSHSRKPNCYYTTSKPSSHVGISLTTQSVNLDLLLVHAYITYEIPQCTVISPDIPRMVNLDSLSATGGGKLFFITAISR